MSEKRISFSSDVLGGKDVDEFLDNAGATIKDNNNYDLMTSYDNDIMNGGAKSDEYSEPTFREDVADINVEESSESKVDKPQPIEKEALEKTEAVKKPQPIEKVDKPKPKVVIENSEPI